MPGGHFAPPGLGDSWTGYCVLGRLFHDLPRPRLQTPLEAAGLVSPGAGPPLAPLAHLATLATFHAVLRRCKAFWALFKAAAFVQVKSRFALGAKVFTEARFTVLYPASRADVEFWGPQSVVSRRTGVEALPILPHPLPPQEQEQLWLAVEAPVILGANRAAFANGVRSIASSFVSFPTLWLTVTVLHAVQDNESKGEKSKLHLDGL